MCTDTYVYIVRCESAARKGGRLGSSVVKIAFSTCADDHRKYVIIGRRTVAQQDPTSSISKKHARTTRKGERAGRAHLEDRRALEEGREVRMDRPRLQACRRVANGQFFFAGFKNVRILVRASGQVGPLELKV